MLTPSSHPSHFQNGIPRLGPQKFFVQIHHIVQNTKERVIWDMSPLNRWGQAQHYKAYPVRTFQALMQAGDYFFGTDIKRYYHSIELESQSKDFWICDEKELKRLRYYVPKIATCNPTISLVRND